MLQRAFAEAKDYKRLNCEKHAGFAWADNAHNLWFQYPW